MKLLSVVILSVIALSLGCGKAIPIPFHPDNKFAYLPPKDLIEAAASRPNGFLGASEFQIRSITEGRGTQSGYYLLNSEIEFNDPQSLMIVIPPSVISVLKEKQHIHPVIDFLGKTIQVRGTAIREQIFHQIENGKQSDQFYYQTQIKIDSPLQISILKLRDGQDLFLFNADLVRQNHLFPK